MTASQYKPGWCWCVRLLHRGSGVPFVFVPLTGPEQGTTIREWKINNWWLLWKGCGEKGVTIPCSQDK
jgi:hypothetical protein